MKVMVFGCGLIGQERVRALVRLRDKDRLVSEFAVCDPFAPGKRQWVESEGGHWFDSVESARAFAPDWAVIATPHDTAVELCAIALAWGSRVLIEKPFGRSLAEAERLASLAADPQRIAVGFNYRFFPGIAAAFADARAGRFGELISINMTIGHGGAPGMEKSWKLDPIRAGGGVILDPGIHLLDLCHCLAPGATLHHLATWEGFWKTGLADEEAHVMFSAGRTVINLQFSIVRWRSTFGIELHGTEGYGLISGRGRSYGPMKYVRGSRWGWKNAANQKASEETVSVSDCEDSFCDEMRALFSGSPVWPAPCNAADAVAVMRTYEACVARLPPKGAGSSSER